MVGEQHVSADPDELGYDVVADADTSQAQDVAPAAVELLRERPPQPFFLSVGFFETHRDYFEPTSVRDALYSVPPPNLPDTPVTRRDMAAFKQSARALDHGVGAVLSALDEMDLADDTLVILTTDHGLPFPGGKATLTDRGIGVLLIMRGPGGFHGGRVNDALVSQIDLFPTLCDLTGIDRPPHLQGRSLLPLVRRERREVNDAVFAELTYHAAYDPQRAIRTRRHKYVRRFGRPRPAGPAERRRQPEQGPAAADGWRRRRARARSSTTWCWTRRGAQPGRRTRTTRTCSTSCARGSSSGWRPRTTRSSRARCRRPRAQRSTTRTGSRRRRRRGPTRARSVAS